MPKASSTASRLHYMARRTRNSLRPGLSNEGAKYAPQQRVLAMDARAC